MSNPEFFQTKMGHMFYEGTMPALVKQLKRLNDNLEKQQLENTKIPYRPIKKSQFSPPGPNQANIPRAAGHIIIRHNPPHDDFFIGGSEKQAFIYCGKCGRRVALIKPPFGAIEEDRCPHGMFYSGAGACPECGRGAEVDE